MTGSDLIERHRLGHLVQPFSARSVVASTLLGTYPPRLAGRLLVALAERFDIAAGTTRVALSRMVAAGELRADDGHYELAGSLRERQQRQDLGRAVVTDGWDGTWEQAVVVTDGRSAAERARNRNDLEALGLGELREGVWLRPANLDPERLADARRRLDDQVRWFVLAPMAADEAAELAGRLFDVDGWSATAQRLVAAGDEATEALAGAADNHAGNNHADGGHDRPLVDGFTVAAAMIRHLVHDPRLPGSLAPDGAWDTNLRAAHARLDHNLSAALRRFFARAQADRA